MEGNLLELAGAYGVLAGYYDELMDEIDYDLWCDYVLGLVACGDTAEGSKSGAEVVGGSAPGGLVAAKPKGYGKIGSRVLDLACGTGQFAYRLGQRGFVVTAVDISSEMLAVAEAKARSLNLEISFFRQDMRQLQLPKCYDLVVCLCDSLNYLLEVDDLTATFSGVARVLEPGGHFVFDLNTEHKLATVYGDNTYAADLGDYAYIWENEYQPDTKLCYMDLAFFVPTLAQFAGAGAIIPVSGFGNAIVTGMMSEIKRLGWEGLFTGAFEITGLGVTTAVVFGSLMAVLFRPKD